MNAPPMGYGGFYNPNPNARWSHLGFSYKNNAGTQNHNSFPKQPFQGNQFQGYPNLPQPQYQQPPLPPPQYHQGGSSQQPLNIYVPPHKKAQEDPN